MTLLANLISLISHYFSTLLYYLRFSFKRINLKKCSLCIDPTVNFVFNCCDDEGMKKKKQKKCMRRTTKEPQWKFFDSNHNTRNFGKTVL